MQKFTELNFHSKAMVTKNPNAYTSETTHNAMNSSDKPGRMLHNGRYKSRGNKILQDRISPQIQSDRKDRVRCRDETVPPDINFAVVPRNFIGP